MATITRIKTPKGAVSFRAQVRVAHFKSAARTFKVEAKEKEAREAAIAWGDALERELKAQSVRGGARRDITQLTVGGLIREFLVDPETQALKTYTSDVVPMTDWWINKYAAERVLDFGVLRLHEARKKLQPGHANATVNRYLSQMRTCWNWGRATGLVPTERAWPSRLMLTEPRGRTRFLSDDEVTSLLKAAEADPVLRAAIIVSVSSGLRQGELLQLTWADIDLDAGTVLIRESKNDEMRSVHLTATAVEELKGLRKRPVASITHPFVNAAGKPLRKSWLEVRWRKIRTAAGLADFRWHDLRHSCASILLQNGATLAQIGGVLGHKSPSMSLRYSHLVAGQAVPGHAALDAKLRGMPV
jgi:integrase